MEPLFDYSLVTSNVGDDVITINATTVTITNGADEPTGDDGGDAFAFIDPANAVNLITDFDSSEDDFLVISASGFGVSVDEGPLSSDNFVSGSGATAADANDYFLFDTDTDEFWFDADGDGLGESPLLIATFNFDSGTLTHGDILIIA